VTRAASSTTTAETPGIRTVEVRPPSARAETSAVARAVFHVVYWSALVISAQTYGPAGGAAAAAAPPSPFERRFQDLPFADQRIFRSLQEGVAEAERLRSTTGRWPRAEDLARAGIPPFAADPIDRARYAWRSVETGTRVDYIGTPQAGSGRETFFALIAEPEPGTPADPLAPVDEIHHRLGDGAMIHVTIWTGPPLTEASEAVSFLPPEQGYRQVLAR
jgi:hypothetical protein